MKNPAQTIKAGKDSFNVQIGSIVINLSNKKHVTANDPSLLFICIIDLEERIERNTSLQEKVDGQTLLELESEFKILEGEQLYLIKELDALIRAYPIKVTPDFVELVYRKFVYDWEDLKTFSLARKLLTVVHSLLGLKFESIEQEVRLRVNALKVSWAIGMEDDAKSHFEKTMSDINKPNRLSSKEKQDYLLMLYDYGCGFNLDLTQEYREFTDNWVGSEKEKAKRQIVSRQCTACRHLRENKLEEVNHWLSENKSLIEKFKKDFKGSSEELNSNLAYYYFVSGAYFWKTKNLDQAYIHLQLSLKFFDLSGLNTDLVERGIIFYLLFKISEAGNIGDCHSYKINAYLILKNSDRKNYCLYSVKEVLEELNPLIY